MQSRMFFCLFLFFPSLIGNTNPTRLLVSSGSCDQVLTQDDVPAILTQPGVYCLAQQLDGQGSTTIDVQSNNIILDLNGKVITGGSVNINVQNANDVIIKNGFIQNAIQTNIAISDCQNISMQNLDVVESVTGILVMTSTQVNIENITFRTHTAEVIFLDAVTNARIIDCRMHFNTNESTILAQNSNNLMLKNVNISQKNVTTSGTVITAAFAFNNVSNSVIDRCQAVENTTTGPGTNTGFSFNQCQSIECTNCMVLNNTSAGNLFGFNFDGSTSSNLEFIDCIANGNESTGGDCFGFSIDGQDNLVRNCIALDNVATSTAAGIRIETTAQRTSIVHNISKNNDGTLGSIGILNNSTSSTVFSNIAQSNPTADYLGPAPLVTYTTAAGTFGSTPEPFDNVDA